MGKVEVWERATQRSVERKKRECGKKVEKMKSGAEVKMIGRNEIVEKARGEQ